MNILKALEYKHHTSYSLKKIYHGYILYDKTYQQYYQNEPEIESFDHIDQSKSIDLRIQSDKNMFDLIYEILKKYPKIKLNNHGIPFNQTLLSNVKFIDGQLYLSENKDKLLYVLKHKKQSMIHKTEPNFNILRDKDFDFLIPRILQEIKPHFNCQEEFFTFIHQYRKDIVEKYEEKLQLRNKTPIIAKIEDTIIYSVHLDKESLIKNSLKSQYTLSSILEVVKKHQLFSHVKSVSIDNKKENGKYHLQIQMNSQSDDIFLKDCLEIFNLACNYYSFLKINMIKQHPYFAFKENFEKLENKSLNDIRDVMKKNDHFIDFKEAQDAKIFELDEHNLIKYKIRNKTIFTALGRSISQFKPNTSSFISSVYPIEDNNNKIYLVCLYDRKNFDEKFIESFMSHTLDAAYQLYQKRTRNDVLFHGIEKIMENFYINSQIEKDNQSSPHHLQNRKIKKL